MLGKTQYALSLAPAGRAMELNCASGKDPDLRGYDATKIDLILFDEMPAAAVLAQKKLMQCPPALVCLGNSATNAFTYHVWVHQKLFVISTNTWARDLARLAPADRNWLIVNSCLVEVEQPLWV